MQLLILRTLLFFFFLFFFCVCISFHREKYRYDKKSNMLSNCWKMISFSFWPSFDIRHYTYETEKKIYRIIPLSMKLMTKLGVKILPNRRLCFGGRPIQGIFLPRNHSFQVELVKRFLVWYSPCVELSNNRYKINKYCMKRREYNFLKMYLQSVGYHHHSWKKGNIYDQFYTPK